MKDLGGTLTLSRREVGAEEVLTVTKLPFSCPFTHYIPIRQNPLYKYIRPIHDPYIATDVITTMAPPLADLCKGLWIGNRLQQGSSFLVTMSRGCIFVKSCCYMPSASHKQFEVVLWGVWHG